VPRQAGGGTHRVQSVEQVPEVTINNEPAGNAPVHVDPDLGVMRTMMAADRTLMAWIRTSLSMFTFGYTLYKVLQEVEEIAKLELHEAAPRNAGIMLTVTGTVALIMGIIEYSVTLRMLRRSYKFRLARPTLVMSVVLTFAGGFLCVGIVSRLL
jgi:putative membrane protein